MNGWPVRIRPRALPTGPPRYVVPCSSSLDPPFSFQTPNFPFPRAPWPFETESRAAGTGLLAGFVPPICPIPIPPPPPFPCVPPPMQQWRRRA